MVNLCNTKIYSCIGDRGNTTLVRSYSLVWAVLYWQQESALSLIIFLLAVNHSQMSCLLIFQLPLHSHQAKPPNALYFHLFILFHLLLCHSTPATCTHLSVSHSWSLPSLLPPLLHFLALPPLRYTSMSHCLHFPNQAITLCPPIALLTTARISCQPCIPLVDKRSVALWFLIHELDYW